MATINLGNIKFKWQGTYNAATAYSIDDVVSYNGSSYICIQASTGNLPTVTAYWEQMSQAGTDGTDLTTTLTTQGDILYRDGSGLARLAAGTNGQALLTGGAGANPSWGTLSSDYVKLGETGAVSNQASINLNGFFSSDYKVYKVFGYGVYGTNAGNGMGWKANTGASYTTQSAAEYFYAADGFYRASGSNGNNSNHGWSDNQCRIGWSGGGSDRENVFELTFYEPQSTTEYKKYSFHTTGWDGSATLYSMTGGGSWRNSAAMTGINIFTYSGNTYANNVVIYGIKE